MAKPLPGLTIRKSALLATCGGAALALGSLTADPDAAFAQAVQATPLIIQGTVSIDSSVPNVDTVTVTGSNAVIDWSPFTDAPGNALTFLPSTGTLNFRGAADFAVINRILPANIPGPAVFEGQVNSYLYSAATGANLGAGGNVLFYSANGIILGETARFDVGRLVLTTLDPDLASYDAFATGTGTLSLVGSPGSTATVELVGGVTSSAQVTATPEGSYFIIAAPGIRQGGIVDVNGSAAYIAGSEVTVGYAGGLFNITIPVGTAFGTTANPTPAIIHSGTTGGPASTGPNDPHAIIGMARGSGPDTFLDILFAGNLGFQPAASATVENGVIVLAANYNVAGLGVLNSFQAADITDGSVGNIQIDSGVITSDLIAHGMIVELRPTTSLTVTGDVFLSGASIASIIGTDAATVTINGNATVVSRLDGEITAAPLSPLAINGQGGTAAIRALGGQVIINGNAVLEAIGVGGADTTLLAAGSAAGGTASVLAESGQVEIGGNLTVDASGVPGLVPNPLSSGGDATGGTASLFAAGTNSAIIVGGLARLRADGLAAQTNGPASTALPGVGIGGAASIDVQAGASADFAGGLTAQAFGAGSTRAAGSGGDGIAGGVTLNVSEASFVSGGDVVLEVSGNGGSAPTGIAGAGFGGDVVASITAGGTMSLPSHSLILRSYGIAGSGATGGSGGGGDVGLTLDTNATATLGGLTFGSTNLGGDSSADNGGASNGGSASVVLFGGSILTVAGQLSGEIVSYAGSSTAATGNGGTGTAGSLLFLVDGSTLTGLTGGMQLATLAIGGGATGGNGGDATGGQVDLTVRNAATLSSAGHLSLGVLASAGNSNSGTGGSADIAGTGRASLTASSGAQLLLSSLHVNADAHGGDSLLGTGGDAGGATASLTATDITTLVNLMQGTPAFPTLVSASSTGGAGATGGNATGGTSQVEFFSSQLAARDLSVITTARGGAGTSGAGGLATGGAATANFLQGSFATLTDIAVLASTLGGSSSGNSGGGATGGTAILRVQDFDTAVTVNTQSGSQVRSDTRGGNAGGGAGLGGAAIGDAANLSVQAAASLVFTGSAALENRIVIESLAQGGNSTVTGGAGGAATSGLAGITVQEGATLTAPAMSLLGTAQGGNGTSASADSVAGGDATTQDVTVDIASSTVSTGLAVVSQATGGAASNAAGGNATAGNAAMSLSGSTFTYRDTLNGTVPFTSRVLSVASGGSVTGTGTGGNATALGAGVNVAATSVFDAATTGDTFAVGAKASGGQSATLLGEGIAGQALFSLSDSRINQGSLRIYANSASTDSAALGGAGQLALSDWAFFLVDNDSTANLTNLSLDASAAGARNGSTTGGIAQVSVQGSGSVLTASTVNLQANAGGGATNQAGWFLLDATPSTAAPGAGGSITIGSLTANATSTTGQASSAQSRLQALAGRISITGTANVTTTGPLLLQTGLGGTILGGTDAATLTGNLAFTTAGLLTISGDDPAAISINADRLSLISNDIDIQSGARLNGVNQMLLRSTNTSAAMVVGGTASATGYTLTQAEAAAIAGRNLTIEAPVTADNATRDIELRDLALTGSQGGGITGLSLVTPGKVQVVGQVRIDNAGATDTLAIRGDQRVELVLPAASLALYAPGGQTTAALPTGIITLRSDQVFMARTPELALMRANPNDATLAALLASDGGATTSASYLMSNTAQIFAGSFLYGQNTGAAGTLSGISVGQATNGLTISKDTTYGAARLKVIAYGQQGYGTGAPVTGDAFFAATRFNTVRVTDYTFDATFNDCNIQAGFCSFPISQTGVPLGNETLLTGPPDAVTLEGVAPVVSDTAFGMDFPGPVTLPGTADEGIVDDWVTSGGDPAAYAGENDDEDDDNAD